jgi:HD-like signal output (HDOD) protein
MVVTQKQSYRSRNKQILPLMNPLWSHALGSAVASRWLAMQLGLHRIAEEAFLAGLLHDIGKLLLLKIIEELQASDTIPRNISRQLITDILEAMHCGQGDLLMRHLNMPDVYCLVVAQHHEAEVKAENVVLNLVRLADLTCRKLGIGLKDDPGLMLSTTPEAINLMATDLLLAQLQVRMDEYKGSMDKFLGFG